jgi:hypothetical protein
MPLQSAIREPVGTGPRRVKAQVNYTAPMSVRARFYANDHSRDNLVLDAREVEIEDGRFSPNPPALTREGLMLVRHKSAVRNFRDPDEVARVYAPEVERLILELTGADRVVVNGMGILRFGERSPEAGTRMNSWPARFIHIDLSDPTGVEFAARSLPGGLEELQKKRRYAYYNVWRVLSEPPQDVPLAVCDARTLSPEDLMTADAVFDAPGQPEWGFEALLVHYNPRHRWIYFSNMSRDEVIVFKTHESNPAEPHHCPHTAFDDPTCPPGVPPRVSIEIRVHAFFDR